MRPYRGTGKHSKMIQKVTFANKPASSWQQIRREAAEQIACRILVDRIEITGV
jgi:hypothetical protein